MKYHQGVTDLLQRAENEIHQRRLLKRGQPVLIGVSGGLDSMVLLHLIHELALEYGWKITVAHFNHQLRGRASDADEELVRKTAAKLKLPFVAGRADVNQFAAQSKLSLEMAARKLRHEFFGGAARKRNISTIALAHHADDQVELFFLRLLRGAGGEGLAGMKWRSASPADAKITLIRPLLCVSKRELAAFADAKNILFRDDATNFSTDFLRNRIRNELLPSLRKHYQPGLDKAALRLMEIVGAEADCVGDLAKEVVSSLRLDPVRPQAEHDTFTILPVAIQRRVLQLQLAQIGVAADFELIEALRRAPDVFVSVGARASICRDKSGEIKLRMESEQTFHPNELALNLSGQTGETMFAGMKVGWRVQPQKQFRLPAKRLAGGPPALREWFDADKVGTKIFLRHWRPGDRFQPIGMKAAAKLQDLFTNAKIPRERRRNLVVAKASGGEIFWIEGLRIGEHFKLTPQTKRRLVWRWQCTVS